MRLWLADDNVGVRSDCIVGVAEEGVGYAALLGWHALLGRGVDVGVDVGKDLLDGPPDTPNDCSDELPGIGVGVEWR